MDQIRVAVTGGRKITQSMDLVNSDVAESFICLEDLFGDLQAPMQLTLDRSICIESDITYTLVKSFASI